MLEFDKMILRVTIANLYSFNEETEISFVAGKSLKHENHVIRAKSRDDISVLKAGIIYGANASGKSNIVKAVSVLQDIAMSGVPKKNVEPFKLVKSNANPSKVEMEFKVKDKYFAYGVEFSIKGIHEEWLYETGSRTDTMIYERKVVGKENRYKFGTVDGNKNIKQFLEFISLATPLSSSFLSEYIKRNGQGLPLINSVYEWFKINLKIIFPESRYDGFAIRAERDKEFAIEMKSLLEYFNTGIVDIRRVKVKKETLNLPNEVLNKLLSSVEPNKGFLIASPLDSTLYFFETDAKGITTIYKQIAIHRNSNNEEFTFEMREESDGTLRLLDFIPMLIDFQLGDSVYLIDEIDRSMHPMLIKKLLEFYFGKLSDSRNTQLIFTTHECHLLDLDLIRTDEVWFVEKDNDGASHLTSLAEYKPRSDVRKGYLQGRYGAIPVIAPVESLKW